MKRLWIGLGIIFAAQLAFSQQAATPQLSTADKVAIGALEQHKQDAKKQFDDAQQGELAIIREWNAAHKGYHLNEQSFLPEPDEKPVAKQEAKPVTPAEQPK